MIFLIAVKFIVFTITHSGKCLTILKWRKIMNIWYSHLDSRQYFFSQSNLLQVFVIRTRILSARWGPRHTILWSQLCRRRQFSWRWFPPWLYQEFLTWNQKRSHIQRVSYQLNVCATSSVWIFKNDITAYITVQKKSMPLSSIRKNMYMEYFIICTEKATSNLYRI